MIFGFCFSKNLKIHIVFFQMIHYFEHYFSIYISTSMDQILWNAPTPNPIQLQKNEEFPHYHHNQSLQVQKQIASAMLLPQPDVPKFRGDPIEYNKFIMAFDTRIIAHTSGETDCLYYLDQLLEGEAKDLIGGCLFIDPINGYHEARKLLEKEYGDPFKISTAYINKVLTWPIIKQEDSLGLKRLALFLVKCESAMSSIFHMSVLNHAPNMQAIVHCTKTAILSSK